ncbi:MAG: diguanylate cyclase [Deltaproteobacteria bacterium]|nr:diguanylate cyclase [Deltaproteobacteria bacterium]
MRAATRKLIWVSLALAFGGALVTDLTLHLEARWRWPLIVLYALVLLASLRRRLRQSDAVETSALLDAELGMLLAVGVMGAIHAVDGGLDGSTWPLVYVLCVVASVLAAPSATAVIVGTVVTLEAAIRFVAHGESSVVPLVVHGGFAATFSILAMAVLRVEVARIRSHSRTRVQAEIERMHDAARSYRLLSATRRTAPQAASAPLSDDDPSRLVRSSVEEIHQAVFFALQLLRRSMGLHTAMLLWLTDTGTHLRISEMTSETDELSEGPFQVGDGVFGAVVAEREFVHLTGLKASYRLPYYPGACPVRVVAAIPVMEQEHVRGILVVDRTEDEPFGEGEQELLVAATRYVLRAIQNERVFVQLERAKVEQGKLYRAARSLGAAMSERDVVEASVRSAREIAAFDFAAITIFDETKRTHEIRAVSGEGADALVGVRYRHNAGLVSMVVQNRYPLPYKGEFDSAHQVIFTARAHPPQLPSMLVLPLLVGDRALGTLVLGAKRRGAFGDSVRPTLEVLASHVAVSLSNARMVKRLEELATSDGLTGLYNKRALLDMVQSKIAAAVRFSRKLSVMTIDLDHFKNVNDTYGHDIGDQVLKGLGAILRKTKRATDVVARFGGEEFVVLCEETDTEGATLMAERVREELQKTTFHTPKGPFNVTCSIGISTFPEAGRDWETLFKASDEALYISKRSGRNKVTAWSPRRLRAA